MTPEQNDIIDLKTQLAVLNEKLTTLQQIIIDLKSESAQMHEMLSRWRGGLIVLVALGSIIIWILTIWERLWKLVPHA